MINAEPLHSSGCLFWLHSYALRKYVTIYIVFQEELGDYARVKEETNNEVKVQKNEMRPSR
jgi:hypothetical protein